MPTASTGSEPRLVRVVGRPDRIGSSPEGAAVPDTTAEIEEAATNLQASGGDATRTATALRPPR